MAATPVSHDTLLIAARERDLTRDFIAQSLKNGADLWAQSLPDNSNVIHACVRANRPASILALLAECPEIRHSFSERAGADDAEQPIFMAIRDKKPALVEALLQAGQFMLNDMSRDLLTPLQAATQTGSAEMALLLLRAGADPNKAMDFDQLSPLHLVLENLRLGFSKIDEMARVLIEHGANPRQINRAKTTPLMAAVANGNWLSIRRLLPLSDVSARDIGGDTAFDRVEQYLALHATPDAFSCFDLFAHCAPIRRLQAALREHGARNLPRSAAAIEARALARTAKTAAEKGAEPRPAPPRSRRI